MRHVPTKDRGVGGTVTFETLVEGPLDIVNILLLWYATESRRNVKGFKESSCVYE